jgi:hypothetical protein
VTLQSSTGGEFLSPSGNISCEMDYGGTLGDQVYCQTFSPAASVTMSLTGALKKCRGQLCLGNPADNAITLAFGRATVVGPFKCSSAKAGVTCTVASTGAAGGKVAGKGFEISRSGIRKLPA